MSEVHAQISRRRFRKRWAALALLCILFVLLAALWSQRRQMATGYVDRELARRGVEARYEIVDLGLGRQRLRNVVIGNPADPDLTAERVELRMSYGLRYPRVAKITARGVRLRGRIVDGRLSLGQLDKLLPAPGGKPFTLPNVSVDLGNAVMRLATPAGDVGISIAGRGNLTGGFRGNAIVLSRQLALAGCTVRAPAARLAVAVSGRRPAFEGPVRAQALICGANLAVDAPRADLDISLAEALDSWTGDARLRSGQLRSGSGRLAGFDARLALDGNARLTRGRLRLAAIGGTIGSAGANRLEFSGRYQASLTGLRVDAQGQVQARGLSVGERTIAPILDALRGVGGTPVEPFGDALALAVARGARALDSRADLELSVSAAGPRVHVASLEAGSRSGARLSLDGGEGVTIGAGARMIDTHLVLTGGGFPRVEASLRQAGSDSPIIGTATVSPYRVGGAQLALAPIRFAAGTGGLTRVDTLARIDGPFRDGQVRGLRVPIKGAFGRGGFAFGNACTPVGFDALRFQSLALGATRLQLCPVGRGIVWKAPGGSVRGAAAIARPRLAGRLGSSPITLAADRFGLDLAAASFTASRAVIRLGSAGYVNRLDLASLSGRVTGKGLEGSFAGGSGQIANVPLLLSQAKGGWSVIGGRARVDGAMTVADEAPAPRFYPLRSDDFSLTLAGSRIDAAGWLNHPGTGTRVTWAHIVHDLGTGRGRADLEVPGITFSDAFQPERLTPLTQGVIALVKGQVQGQGAIAWTREGATSSGSFSTAGMDLAAPFGPVTGLTTTIRFTDLLGLATAPDQEAFVQRVQTGIDVFDGRVRYQLLPGLKVRVQSGEWPFAGGRLLLDESLLDFSQPSAKQLIFRVVGMDAAAFVELMKFSNLAATGTFDGAIPMVFDDNGGRIVDGRLVARADGGTVSYIGELTEADLGAYGKLAFDALKSLRYSKLAVTLDGELDGEFVAGVELDGIAREAPNPGGIPGMALRQLAKIPFEFNIVARGPFRAIIGTMRSLKDPSGLIQQVLPPEIRDQPTTIQPRTGVQTKESETMR